MTPILYILFISLAILFPLSVYLILSDIKRINKRRIIIEPINPELAINDKPLKGHSHQSTKEKYRLKADFSVKEVSLNSNNRSRREVVMEASNSSIEYHQVATY